MRPIKKGKHDKVDFKFPLPPDGERDHLITEKYVQARSAYKGRLKDAQRDFDDSGLDTSQTRKKGKKGKSGSRKPDPRDNVIDASLDPANGIRVSESVMSKGKLTEPSREEAVAQDPSIVNMDSSPSGEIRDQ